LSTCNDLLLTTALPPKCYQAVIVFAKMTSEHVDRTQVCGPCTLGHVEPEQCKRCLRDTVSCCCTRRQKVSMWDRLSRLESSGFTRTHCHREPPCAAQAQHSLQGRDRHSLQGRAQHPPTQLQAHFTESFMTVSQVAASHPQSDHHIAAEPSKEGLSASGPWCPGFNGWWLSKPLTRPCLILRH